MLNLTIHRASPVYSLVRYVSSPNGPHKPCTGPCTNHPSAIVAAPALIYSTRDALGVSCMDYYCPFHLCSLLGTLSRYTVLKVWAVRWPMRVCCSSRWRWCVLFINILDSLRAPCLVYNTIMYTVYGRCGQYGSMAGARFICCVPFKSWTRVHEFTTGEKAFHWRRDLVNS